MGNKKYSTFLHPRRRKTLFFHYFLFHFFTFTNEFSLIAYWRLHESLSCILEINRNQIMWNNTQRNSCKWIKCMKKKKKTQKKTTNNNNVHSHFGRSIIYCSSVISIANHIYRSHKFFTTDTQWMLNSLTMSNAHRLNIITLLVYFLLLFSFFAYTHPCV